MVRNSDCSNLSLSRAFLSQTYSGNGLKVNGIDPQVLDDINVNRAGIKASFRKMIATGAGDFVLESVKFDFTNPLIDLQIFMPIIDVKGFCEILFNLGWLNSPAKGRARIQVTDLRMRFSFLGRLDNRNGTTYIKFDQFKIATKIGKISIQLLDLFHDRAVNTAVNNFINNNIETFLPEIEAEIRQTLGESAARILKLPFVFIHEINLTFLRPKNARNNSANLR